MTAQAVRGWLASAYNGGLNIEVARVADGIPAVDALRQVCVVGASALFRSTAGGLLLCQVVLPGCSWCCVPLQHGCGAWLGCTDMTMTRGQRLLPSSAWLPLSLLLRLPAWRQVIQVAVPGLNRCLPVPDTLPLFFLFAPP